MRLSRVPLVFLLLFLFLVGIKLIEASFHAWGGDEVKQQLISGFHNPFAGLCAGILATVVVQSSSVTTSTIVGLVGSGTLPMSIAVPMIMGANIGTTVTNTLVSMGHVARSEEFRRAFAGATVHDFFNMLTVLVLFPLELFTGFLERSALWLALMVQHLPQAGGKLPSPLKDAVKFVVQKIERLLGDVLGLEGAWMAGAIFIVAVVLIMFTLYFITGNMKSLMAERIEQMLNRVLGRRASLGLIIGVVITVAVQSSSITTSLLIPLFGAGLLQLRAGFPIMIGANLGTTVTALIAAMVSGIHGLQIAVVHLLFNICGALIFFFIPAMRNIPIWCAERLADLALVNRVLVVVYVGTVFVLLPLLGIFSYKMFAT